MRAWLPLLALALSACETDKTVSIDCEEIAILDDAGNPDPCDVQACEAAADGCSGGFAVWESYPPKYSCDGASFSVFDFCPDWTAATATEN